jgi:AcrR family transcriptional regulator
VEIGTAKQRILDRAYYAASKHGLESLTIGRLASDLSMSKAGVHGHFGSKQALQLATIRHALSVSQRDVAAPAEGAPDGLPRLWALCVALTSYREEIGLHGGDFWVTVANEYDSRSGPVRDAVEAIMSRWMRRLEDLISTAVKLGQLTPCDPAQLAFEIQALLDAGGHQGWLYRDPKAPARARAAIHRRLDELRTPDAPDLTE